MSHDLMSNFFKDLSDENFRLLTELSFERQLNEKLEKFRKYSLDLKTNCFCRQNKQTFHLLDQLDIEYKKLLSSKKPITESDVSVAAVGASSSGSKGSTLPTQRHDIADDIKVKIKDEPIDDNDDNGSDDGEEIISKIDELIGIMDDKNNADEDDDSEDTIESNDETMDSIDGSAIDISSFMKVEFSLGTDEIHVTAGDHTSHSSNAPFVALKREPMDQTTCDTTRMATKKSVKCPYVYVCPACGKQFLNKGFFDVHLKTHPSGGSVTSAPSGGAQQLVITEKRINVIKCQVIGCGKVCKKLSEFRNHMRYHSEGNFDGHRFSCPMDGCAYKGRDRFNVSQHMRSHGVSQERPFKCPTGSCGKSFKTQECLDGHIRAVHYNDAKGQEFKCPAPGCPRVFASQHGLKLHERVHTRRASVGNGSKGVVF